MGVAEGVETASCASSAPHRNRRRSAHVPGVSAEVTRRIGASFCVLVSCSTLVAVSGRGAGALYEHDDSGRLSTPKRWSDGFSFSSETLGIDEVGRRLALFDPVTALFSGDGDQQRTAPLLVTTSEDAQYSLPLGVREDTLVLLEDARRVERVRRTETHAAAARQPTMGMAPSNFLTQGHQQLGSRGSATKMAQVAAETKSGGNPSMLEPRWSIDCFWWLRFLTFGCMIKGLSIASSLCTQFAPLPEVAQIISVKNTGCKESLSYVCIACTGMQWCLYGISAYLYTGNHGFLVVVYANIVGACMGVYYSFSFFRFVSEASMQFARMKLYMTLGVSAFLLQLLLFFRLPHEQCLLASGCVSATLSVLVTISPLATLPTVLESRSVESMPVELSVVSFVSSWLWLACGLLLNDWWILIPNIVGILVGVVTCYLIFGYSKEYEGSLQAVLVGLFTGGSRERRDHSKAQSREAASTTAACADGTRESCFFFQGDAVSDEAALTTAYTTRTMCSSPCSGSDSMRATGISERSTALADGSPGATGTLLEDVDRSEQNSLLSQLDQHDVASAYGSCAPLGSGGRPASSSFPSLVPTTACAPSTPEPLPESTAGTGESF